MSEEYRDTLYTVDKKGNRVWVYPKFSPGKFFNLRKIVASFLIIFYFGLPWIHMHGKPLVQLDLQHRTLFLLGYKYIPEDLFLFSLLLITFVLCLFLFTALLGRVWCGWACPQTVFLDFMYRPIERLIEGDRAERIALDKAPWGFKKIIKKVTKQILFLSLSWLVANTLLMYFWGYEKVFQMITHSPSENPYSFIFSLGVIAFFQFDFAWFREQMCTIACPYGRFQGVLLDTTSLVVSYDQKRGEPRTKLAESRKDPTGKGDCIDCKQCVMVCPTGIDIRNGLQMECLHCTACIDACNAVMTSIKKPQNLIRYADSRGQSWKLRNVFRPRVYIYIFALSVVVSLFIYGISRNSAVELILIRSHDKPYTKIGELISNQVFIEVYNHSLDDSDYSVKFYVDDKPYMETDKFKIVIPESTFHLESGSKVKLPIFVNFDGSLKKSSVKVEVTSKETKNEKPINLLAP